VFVSGQPFQSSLQNLTAHFKNCKQSFELEHLL